MHKRRGAGWWEDFTRGADKVFHGDLQPLVHEIVDPNSRGRQVYNAVRSVLGGRRKGHKGHRKAHRKARK